MKINFWTSKKYTFKLIINKRYKTTKTIIPIGCDCHPAHMLKTINLRKESLPFDWLDTKPLYGIQYAYENIINKFEFFLSELKKNKQDKVYSSFYKYSTFYHYNNLIENKKLQIKLQKRCIKLLKLIKIKPCIFLNTVTSESLENEETVQAFLNSIVNFRSIIKRKDVLIIYLRYDENLIENKEFCDKLIDQVEKIKNVRILQYIRKKEKFGIWGNEKEYNLLIKRMGIKYLYAFPKINFTKNIKC